MNSLEFLMLRLKELHLRFPNCNFRYEYRENRDSHIIEVMPKDLYNNTDYKIAETDLEDEFESKYPLENVIFISEDSLNKVTNPVLELINQFDLSDDHKYDDKLYFVFDIHDLCFSEIDSELQYAGENNYALAA